MSIKQSSYRCLALKSDVAQPVPAHQMLDMYVSLCFYLLIKNILLLGKRIILIILKARIYYLLFIDFGTARLEPSLACTRQVLSN